MSNTKLCQLAMTWSIEAMWKQKYNWSLYRFFHTEFWLADNELSYGKCQSTMKILVKVGQKLDNDLM